MFVATHRITCMSHKGLVDLMTILLGLSLFLPECIVAFLVNKNTDTIQYSAVAYKVLEKCNQVKVFLLQQKTT